MIIKQVKLYCSNWNYIQLSGHLSVKLTETWGKSNTIEQKCIPGYNHVFDIRSKRTGGGCSLYINEDISYKVRKDLKLAESVFIEVAQEYI